jgi:ABC-type branched-subunit amino acid transport system permease subunit
VSGPLAAAATAGTAPPRVTRSRRPVAATGLLGLLIVVLLAALPLAGDVGTTDTLINLLVLVTIALMWNLLAGYAGLVSVGQQAFIGLGAYLVLILAQRGLDPYLALPLAALGCAVLAVPIWWLVRHLRGGYFAIATWVIADACQLIISHFSELGGGTGTGLPGMDGFDPIELTNFTYWAALAVAVGSVVLVYLVLRSRLGLVLTAVRDDEIGARSVGSRVAWTQRLVFIVAAFGCGAAGGVVIISQLNVEPVSAFSITYTAQMIFITVIGGIGSIEGPILGAIVFFGLQQVLAAYGAWYLILLGAIAVVVSLWTPSGLWGLIGRRLPIRAFPVGYWLWSPSERSEGGPETTPSSTPPPDSS